MQDLMPTQCFPGRRDVLIGLLAFVVLGNVTFVSFLWGDRTLQNSARFASLYANGSATAPMDLHVARESDPTAGDLQTEPWFALEREQMLREHRFPLWNPYSGDGVPLAADMQSQPYSPFAWIGILWLSSRGYDAFIAIRMIVAGLLAFLFLRTFVNRTASLAGGAAYMFTGYLWLYLSLPQLSVEVVTPGLFLAVECVVRRPSLRSAAGLGAMLGVSLLGGMPESSALAVVFAATYAVARILGDGAIRRAGRVATAYLGIGFALGCGLSAIAVVPFLEYVGISSNSHQSGAASLLDLPPDPFTMQALAQYLAPLMFGSPHGMFAVAGQPVMRGFFGVSAAFFALLAVFASTGDALRKRSRDAPPVFFFACGALIFLTRRFGFVLTAPIAKLPVLHRVLLNKYEEAIVGLCVAALVAFGVARLSERRVTVWSVLFAIGLPVVVLAIGHFDGGDLAAWPGAVAAPGNALGAACAFLTLITILASVAIAKRSISERVVARAALVLVAIEVPLTFVAPLYYGSNAGGRQEASALLGAPYVSFLASHAGNGERFYGENHLLTPNWGAAFGIADVRDLDALYPARYFPFARAFLGDRDPFELLYFFIGTHRIDLSNELQRRFLELSSVHYYGVDKSYPNLSATAPAGAHVVFSSPRADVYELPVTLPRAALYRRIVRARDGADALRILRSPEFSLGREAIVEGAAPELDDLARNAPSPARFASIDTDASGDVRVAVRASSRALLVLDDTNYPGWNATIDGRPVPILNANYLFRGVVVTRGEHVVAFRYAPASFFLGAATSIASFVVLLSAAIGSAFTALRRAPRGEPERLPTGSSCRSSS